MDHIAIHVKNISKIYNFGSQDYFEGSLKSHLAGLFSKKSHHPAGDKEFYALNDISFEVKKGEVLGIIGHNGAGKTTLLKILSGVTEPTCGSVEIRGRVASILEVGTGFHPELTGRENVYLSGTILGLSKKEIDAKFDEIISFSGVEKFIDTPVKHYSSGMYIRLAFSVMVNIDADILLFDEVMSMGDSEFQNMSARKIFELIESGKTVLLVSHNMNDILKLCKRVIHIQNGMIIKVGLPSSSVINYLESINIESSNLITHKIDASTLEKINHSDLSSVFKIEALQITKNRKPLVQDLYVDESFEINMVITKYDSRGLNIAFNFYHMGNLFLATSTLHTKNQIINIKDEGEYNLYLKLFPNFLNSSFFTIDSYIYEDANDRALQIKNALSFRLKDRLSKSDDKIYRAHQQFFGPMLPHLEWEIIKNPH